MPLGSIASGVLSGVELDWEDSEGAVEMPLVKVDEESCRFSMTGESNDSLGTSFFVVSVPVVETIEDVTNWPL